MTGEKDPLIFIEHILESIALIRSYLQRQTHDTFIQSPELQDSIVRRLEIIGEAVRHLPAAIREHHPEVPWRDISGMRDNLIHEYFNVDLEVTWNTAMIDLPKFERQINKIANEMRLKSKK